MAKYRVYFYPPNGHICGRDDFDGDDHSAITTTPTVFDDCSDVARKFEVWNGAHLRRPEPITLNELTERKQQVVVEVDQFLRDSNWAIASGQRLLRKLSEISKI